MFLLLNTPWLLSPINVDIKSKTRFKERRRRQYHAHNQARESASRRLTKKYVKTVGSLCKLPLLLPFHPFPHLCPSSLTSFRLSRCWSWPQEGPPLSSHKSTINTVLAYLSTRFALPPLFCDITKFIGVEKLVAGPCQIASLVLPVVEVIEEITVHIASRTTLSTITLMPPPIALPPQPGPNTLPEYVAPPDFMDLLIPYSLLFVWAFGMIYILVFSGSTGILAPTI
jgi:hypothetical protein